MASIAEILEKSGPMTGKALSGATGMDLVDLWKASHQNETIIYQTAGERYLRFDKHVEGYARLSPSIIREFSNYMAIGLPHQASAVSRFAEKIRGEIITISRQKFELACEIMTKVVDAQESPDIIREKACFIISGDVACNMAHREPRPEYSTGKLVNGSDLDIVVITRELPGDLVKNLDDAIYAQKAYLLLNPIFREEIDYIIKDMIKVEKQLDFDSFESMVASKVLEEGRFLCGNQAMFNHVKKMLDERGIPGILATLAEKAALERQAAFQKLLCSQEAIHNEELMQLFITTEEREEFF